MSPTTCNIAIYLTFVFWSGTGNQMRRQRRSAAILPLTTSPAVRLNGNYIVGNISLDILSIK